MQFDVGRLLDPVTLRKAQATPGMSGTNFYQSVINCVMVNNAKKPFDDPECAGPSTWCSIALS